MRKIILMLLLTSPIIAVSQTYKSSLKLTSDSDPNWRSIVNRNIELLGLKKTEDIEENYVFRYWMPNGLLEIKKSSETLTGSVTHFVMKVSKNDSKEAFLKEYPLPFESSIKLYDLIISHKALNLPSDIFIEDWKKGLDGISPIFEIKNDTSHSLKVYWSPNSQGDLTEAQVVLDFLAKEAQIVNPSEYWNMFEKTIPFNAYRYPGASYSVVKITTLRKQRKKERKKRQD
jgi:hypothetical protein